MDELKKQYPQQKSANIVDLCTNIKLFLVPFLAFDELVNNKKVFQNWMDDYFTESQVIILDMRKYYDGTKYGI